ncbi:MAG: hypothetical protein H7A09_09715 [Oceanospirillaceae bacterium]|nr:hypothetical protein [Oceanospirillaceae bacterium]MCP5334422.1 hypothetical protein [Oceanospirillaceae bacterium]MCP5350660.1 hypothetical protein [Oceanospirillaceae bacterium]
MRTLCFLAGLIVAGSVYAAPDIMPDSAKNTYQDALYGETLYFLHSGEYEKALGLAADLEARNRRRYGKELDIYRASAQMGLGINTEAEITFRRLIADPKGSFIAPRARSHAWFYLGKQLYQNNQGKDALTVMRLVEVEQLDKVLTDEFHFYLATLELFYGKAGNADAHILAIDVKSPWAAYAFLNLALSYTERDVNFRQVESAFDKALELAPNTENPAAFTDKIHLMAGQFFYAQGRGRSAIDHLRDISLEGPYSSKALLTYGWALTEQWRYHDALQPWYMLKTSRNPLSQEVQETYVAIPHLLEKLNAKVLALGAFEYASEQYDTVIKQLDTSAKRLAKDDFTAPLLAQQAPGEWGSYKSLNLSLPDHPDNYYLADVMLQPDFYAEFTLLRDLNGMRQELTSRLSDMDAFSETIAIRKKEYKTLVDDNVIAKKTAQLASFETRYRDLLKEMSAAFKNIDGTGLASPDEKNQLALFNSVSARIKKSRGSRGFNEKDYQQRLRRVKGVLMWELGERYTARKDAVSKNLAFLEDQLRTARKQIVATRLAYEDAPQAFEGFDLRIANAKKDIQSKLLKNDKLMTSQKQVMYALVNNDITRRQAQVAYYAQQARLAAARLFDETSNQKTRVAVTGVSQ